MVNYLCPKTKIPLKKDKEGNLCSISGNKEIIYKNCNGCINFTFSVNEDEYRFYNDEYIKSLKVPDFSNLGLYWNEKYQRYNKILFDRLPDLKDKKILLLGNGLSEKEFFFLELGAYLIYSDISLAAVMYMKNAFKNSPLFEKYQNRIEFHAIDALNLPFPESSLDVIYGYAFVHHIGNLPGFFAEICRVLTGEGEGVFFDNAYSPIWHFLKNTAIKPLQKYSHKKHGISPEDLRATKEGGFQRDKLEKCLKENRLKLCFFYRFSFFSYLWERGMEKILGNEKIFKIGMPFFISADAFLARYLQLFRNNQIRLIWTVKKI